MIFEDSRYALSEIFFDDNGAKVLTLRDRVYFQDVEGITPHPVEAGDTLHNLAERYWDEALPDASEYWWVIADFQPTPIHDPTLALVPGETILIPPASIAQEAMASTPDQPLSAL